MHSSFTVCVQIIIWVMTHFRTVELRRVCIPLPDVPVLDIMLRDGTWACFGVVGEWLHLLFVTN